jgi:integrase
MLLEIGEKILGLSAADIRSTAAYRNMRTLPDADADDLTRCRFLAYATTTWKRHASSIRCFIDFCKNRELNMFECTPSILNLFLLKIAQDGKTTGFMDSFLDAYKFVVKFFDMPSYASDTVVQDVRKFVEKVTVRNSRTRVAFGSAEVRKLWDKMENDYGSVESWSKLRLRTFVMSVFQHKTFCRFSDLEKIKIEDVIFNADYFKVFIRYSKTDQSGHGTYVYLPKCTTGFKDAHMLMCVYIQRMDFNDSNSADMYLFPPLK